MKLTSIVIDYCENIYTKLQKIYHRSLFDIQCLFSWIDPTEHRTNPRQVQNSPHGEINVSSFKRPDKNISTEYTKLETTNMTYELYSMFTNAKWWHKHNEFGINTHAMAAINFDLTAPVGRYWRFLINYSSRRRISRYCHVYIRSIWVMFPSGQVGSLNSPPALCVSRPYSMHLSHWMPASCVWRELESVGVRGHARGFLAWPIS